MQDPEPSDGEPSDAVSATVRDLLARVGELATELAELRASLANEMRSRRIVVVEEDGFERIVLGARGQFGHITVLSRTPPGSSTLAELFANDAVEADVADAGMALTDRGEVVASLDVTHDRPPRWWSQSDRGEHT